MWLLLILAILYHQITTSAGLALRSNPTTDFRDFASGLTKNYSAMKSTLHLDCLLLVFRSCFAKNYNVMKSTAKLWLSVLLVFRYLLLDAGPFRTSRISRSREKKEFILSSETTPENLSVAKRRKRNLSPVTTGERTPCPAQKTKRKTKLTITRQTSI